MSKSNLKSKGLNIGNGVVLPLEAVTESIAILAVRRAGKSNAAVVMAEEMHRNNLHWIAIDPKGDWWGVRSSKDGKGPGLPVVIFGGQHGDVPLEPTSGQMIADLIVDRRVSCVLDVSGFDSEAAKIRFLLAFGDRLFRRKDRRQEPTHVFFEEVDDYCPQKPFHEQARLVHTMAKILKQGGSRGLGGTIISQRSAVVNKDLLTQVQTLFALRTTSPQDRKAIQGWVSMFGENEKIIESLPRLADGEAWVWSPNWLNQTKKFQFHRRSTYDSGSTPKIGGSRRPPATLADIDIGSIKSQMIETVKRAEDNDPSKLKQKISQLEQKLSLACKGKVVPAGVEERIAKLEHERQYWKQLSEAAGNNRINAVRRLESLTGSIVPKLQGIIDACQKISGESINEKKEFDDLLKRLPTLAINSIAKTQTGVGPIRLQQQAPLSETRSLPRPPKVERRPDSSGSFDRPEGPTAAQRRILDALARFESLGLTSPKIQVVAAMSGYAHSGGAWNNNRSRLNVLGLIQISGGTMQLTERGREIADFPKQPVTSKDLQQAWSNLFPAAVQKMFSVIINVYPQSVSKEELAEATNYSVGGGAFNNNLSRLRSTGAVVNDGPGRVRASDLVFPEGLV